MKVRVRFAPSPTGYLHIGSARTALFNWLYARHHGGQFIIRIEDTDQTRSKGEFLKEILDSLRWLGLTWDEGPEVNGPHGPYFQSQRLERYRQAADQLLQRGYAEREQGPAGEAVVFRVGKFLHDVPADYQLSFTDLLHGEIKTALPQLLENDIVLMKSDGLPTYNFACVVDDAAMAITHVIRGDDHISNTPKQAMLYQALQLKPPIFAHIPLIVDEERARLSKRKGATGISEFRDLGYLPEGIFNYLALLGWAPGNNREIVSPKEIVKLFELERVKKTAAQFDEGKLNWVNTAYLRQRSVPDLANLVSSWMVAHGTPPPSDRAWFERVVGLFVKRLEVLGDITEQAGYFFTDRVTYDPQTAEQFLQRPGLREDLVKLAERFKSLEPFTAEAAEQAARQLCTELGRQPKEVFHPTRVALTGRSVSPGLFEMIALFGKERTLQRLADAITYLEARVS